MPPTFLSCAVFSLSASVALCRARSSRLQSQLRSRSLLGKAFGRHRSVYPPWLTVASLDEQCFARKRWFEAPATPPPRRATPAAVPAPLRSARRVNRSRSACAAANIMSTSHSRPRSESRVSGTPRRAARNKRDAHEPRATSPKRARTPYKSPTGNPSTTPRHRRFTIDTVNRPLLAWLRRFRVEDPLAGGDRWPSMNAFR